MAIKPIDLQSNMSQVSEVGRNEQARSDALAGQQHLLAKESDDKSRLVNTKLEEARKAESSRVRNEEKKRRGRKRRVLRKGADEKAAEKKSDIKDDRVGNIIDVLK